MNSRCVFSIVSPSLRSGQLQEALPGQSAERLCIACRRVGEVGAERGLDDGFEVADHDQPPRSRPRQRALRRDGTAHEVFRRFRERDGVHRALPGRREPAAAVVSGQPRFADEQPGIAGAKQRGKHPVAAERRHGAGLDVAQVQLFVRGIGGGPARLRGSGRLQPGARAVRKPEARRFAAYPVHGSGRFREAIAERDAVIGHAEVDDHLLAGGRGEVQGASVGAIIVQPPLGREQLVAVDDGLGRSGVQELEVHRKVGIFAHDSQRSLFEHDATVVPDGVDRSAGVRQAEFQLDTAVGAGQRRRPCRRARRQGEQNAEQPPICRAQRRPPISAAARS